MNDVTMPLVVPVNVPDVVITAPAGVPVAAGVGDALADAVPLGVEDATGLGVGVADPFGDGEPLPPGAVLALVEVPPAGTGAPVDVPAPHPAASGAQAIKTQIESKRHVNMSKHSRLSIRKDVDDVKIAQTIEADFETRLGGVSVLAEPGPVSLPCGRFDASLTVRVTGAVAMQRNTG